MTTLLIIYFIGVFVALAIWGAIQFAPSAINRIIVREKVGIMKVVLGVFAVAVNIVFLSIIGLLAKHTSFVGDYYIAFLLLAVTAALYAVSNLFKAARDVRAGVTILRAYRRD